MTGHPADFHDAAALDALLPAAVPVLLAAGYLRLAARARRGNPEQGWNAWRTGSFLTGTALLALAVLPPIAPFAHGDFRGHMLQHLLIGMYAPPALVLGAPVTLLLRTLRTRHARTLSRVLRGRPLHLLANPAIALLLSVGSLAALYFTPLYTATTGEPLWHQLLHVHFLLSGCLFAWLIAGPDPAPRRPTVLARLVLLGIAVAAHATISQLMYAGLHLDVDAPTGQIRGAAELMYYGGDIAELLLALALVTTWRPVRAAHRPQRSPAVATGASHSRTSSSSAWHSVTEQPAMSSEVT
jgi:putative membrane protein